MPNKRDKSEDKRLKMMKFPAIIPMVKTESFKDAANTEGKKLKSGAAEVFLFSESAASPFVKRPIITEGKM